MKSTLILYSLIIGICLLGTASADFSNTGYVQEITKDFQSEKNKSKTSQAARVMNTLCTNIYKKGEITAAQIYDPRQSIFVTLFCGSFSTQDNQIQDDTILPYLKRQKVSDINILCGDGQQENSDPYCIPGTITNSLDYNMIMLKTIKKVQNEWGNIGLVRAYGLQNISLSKKESEIENNYLATYYNVLGKTPEAKDYPKTHAKLVQYRKDANKILKKLYLIDIKKIKELESEITSENNTNRQILLSGAFFDTNTDQSIVIHSLYNELFFYTLFSSVYNEYLPNFLIEKNESSAKGLQNIIKIEDRIAYIQSIGIKNRNNIQHTTQQTIKEINTLQSAFSVHIGLELYKESLYTIRKRLSNLFIPLHQLHYKLENVQKK